MLPGKLPAFPDDGTTQINPREKSGLRKEDADLKPQAVSSDAGDVTGCPGKGGGRGAPDLEGWVLIVWCAQRIINTLFAEGIL